MNTDMRFLWWFRDTCERYSEEHLKEFGHSMFIIERPMGNENERKLVRYIEDKHKLKVKSIAFDVILFEKNDDNKKK